VSRTPLLPGVDPGDGPSVKMSKSRGNAIWLRDDSQTVKDKVATLGGPRLRAFVDAFIDDEDERNGLLASIDDGSASEGAVRGEVARTIENILAPMRARRAEISAERGRVEEIVVDGTIRAREVAYTTLARVRELMGLEGLWQGLVAATEARAEARKAPY
jgi:tryptophanyl-tRNA synthetase